MPTISTMISPSAGERLLENKRGSNQHRAAVNDCAPPTYLQGQIRIHREFGDLIGPRQKLLGIMVQIIIEDCSLRRKLDCLHLLMPPAAELRLTTGELRGAREILVVDLKAMPHTCKARPRPAEQSVRSAQTHSYRWQ